MRTPTWARWATCALAISICVPALASAKAKRSLADCTTFDQSDKDDDTVELTIRNSCTVPIDCSVSWRVVCAPESAKRRAVHPGTSKLALETGVSSSAEASATICGDDAWSIEDISWTCEPSKG